MDGKLILDVNNPVTIRLSNDAYYYFFEGEDPLDENSLDEIAEISAMFEFGFEPDENKLPKINTSNGTVEVTIIPYIEDLKQEQNTLEFDESIWDGVYKDSAIFPWMFYFKFICLNKVKIAQINMHFNKRLNDCEGECVWLNKKPWIKYKTEESHKGYSYIPILSPRTIILDIQNVQEFLVQE